MPHCIFELKLENKMKKSEFIKECIIWIQQQKDYKILNKRDRIYIAEKTYLKFKHIIDRAEIGTLRVVLR